MVGIKDFKMPKGCGDCACYDVEWARCVFVNKSAEDFDKRLAECPLVADVAPVIHAFWTSQNEMIDNVYFEQCICANCRHDNGENWEIGSQIPYCSNCGAKMDFDEVITNDRYKEEEKWDGE